MTYACLEAPQVKSFDEALLERRQGSVRDDRKGWAVGIQVRPARSEQPQAQPVSPLEGALLRVCDFFNLWGFLRHLSLLFSVPVCKHIQESHKL
jgi:hypothetical protein